MVPFVCKKRSYGLGLAAVVAVVLLLGASPAWARRGGLASQGCTGCHSGGATPTVTITADPAVINPGQMVTISVAITTPSVAGLYMTASQGPLTLIAGLGHSALGLINWHVLGSLLVGSIPAIIVMSIVSARASDTAVRVTLALVLIAVCVRFWFA